VYLIILLLKEEEEGEHCKSMVDKAIKLSQVRKAIDALLTFIGKQNDASTNLLEEEDFIYLVRRMSRIACQRLIEFLTLYTHWFIFNTGNCTEKGTRDAKEGQTHPHPSPQSHLQCPRHRNLSLCQRSQGGRACRIQIQG
jgi:hypothetical protein